MMFNPIVMKRMRAAMRRLQDQIDDLRDSLDLAEARATGGKLLSIDEVRRDCGLPPIKD